MDTNYMEAYTILFKENNNKIIPTTEQYCAVTSKIDEIRKSVGIHPEMDAEEYLNYFISHLTFWPNNPNIKYAYIGPEGQFIGTTDLTNKIVSHILLSYWYLLNYYTVTDEMLDNPSMLLDDIGCLKISPDHILLYGNASAYKEKKYLTEQQETTLKLYIECVPIIGIEMGLNDTYFFVSDILQMDRIMLYKYLCA